MSHEISTYAADIYSADGIMAPHRHYDEIRRLGPVVYLEAQDVFAIGRYAEVNSALLHHRTFVSGDGAALNAVANGIGRGAMLGSAPPRPSALRALVGELRTPNAVAELRSQIDEASRALVARLVRQGSFDGVIDFARFLPVSIVSSLVGLPAAGRDAMLGGGTAAPDSISPGSSCGVFSRHWSTKWARSRSASRRSSSTTSCAASPRCRSASGWPNLL